MTLTGVISTGRYQTDRGGGNLRKFRIPIFDARGRIKKFFSLRAPPSSRIRPNIPARAFFFEEKGKSMQP